MKRLLFSFVGGLFIPSMYAGMLLIIVSLVTIITSSAPIDSKWYWLLSLPLEWSGHLYNRFFPTEGEPNLGELRVQVFLINVISDFLVSSLLTYVYLLLRLKRKPRLVLETAQVRTNEAHTTV
jgi:hypothetical protein